MFPDEPSAGRYRAVGSYGNDGGESDKYLAYMLISIGPGKVQGVGSLSGRGVMDEVSWTRCHGRKGWYA